MTEPVRLAKRLAELVACSRREAELYIAGGWVRVDGRVVEEPGFKVSPQQKIDLDRQASLAPIEPVTILLHKPPGYVAGTGPNAALALITPEHRSADDRSPLDFLRRHLVGLDPIMPLETNASGLLVLSQDGRVARKLVEEAAKLEQEYIVQVEGVLDEQGMKRLNQGLMLDGRELPPAKVSWQNETRLRFALKGGQLGQIQRMCDMVGLKVLALKRIRIGRVPMAGMAQGRWRYLGADERF